MNAGCSTDKNAARVDFTTTVGGEQVQTSYKIEWGVTEEACKKTLRSGSLAILRHLQNEGVVNG